MRSHQARLFVALSTFALVFGLVPVVAAQPQSEHVKIEAGGFSPARVTIALHDVVHWSNTDTSAHRVRSDEDGFFDSGRLAPGDVSSGTVFVSAGTFKYHCVLEPKLTGVVEVRVRIRPGKNKVPTPGALIKIRVATEPLANRVYDVQRKIDDGHWKTFRRRTGHAVVQMRPREIGTYWFRARVHLTSNDAVSRWSPPRSKEVWPRP